MDAASDKQVNRAGTFFLVWFALFAIVFAALSIATAQMGKLQWAAKSGRAVPDQFTYLYFPRAETAPVYPEQGDDPVGALDRAVAVTQLQLEQGGRVNIFFEDRIGALRLVDLRAAPSDEYGDAHLANWRSYVAERDEPSLPDSAEIIYEQQSERYTRAELTEIYESGEQDVFAYATDGEYTEPLRWVKRTGAGGALNLAANVLSAAVLATVGALGFAALAAFIRKRRSAARSVASL